MSRILETELERLKREVSLERICARYGIELKQCGKDLASQCPWHEDDQPSFKVTPGKNLWNCLAGCGGGDNLQLVMRCEKVSFLRAVDILREMLGERPQVPASKARGGKEHPILVEKWEVMEDAQLLGTVADFYHQTFLNEARAMAYLQQRRCFHPEAVKLFKIGYANRTLGYCVPATMTAGRKLKEELTRVGVFRPGSGHEHLNGSVVVPLLECGPHGQQAGNVVQMYGRKVCPRLRAGTPDHLYLEGPLRGIFNHHGILGQKEVLLCESILDALTLWCAGFRNVTCTFGTQNFTADLWALLEEVKPQRVVLCFDNDDAGNKAVAKYGPMLAERGMTVLRAALPPGKDINAVACSTQNAAKALATVLELAEVVAVPRFTATLPTAASSFLAAKAPLSANAAATTIVVERAAGTVEASVEAGSEVDTASAAVHREEPSATNEKNSVAPEPVPAALSTTAFPAALSSTTASPASVPAALSSIASPASDPASDHHFLFGECEPKRQRRWRVRGLAKNLSYETLRVSLRVLIGQRENHCSSGSDRPSGSDDDIRFHQDTLDLGNAKHREGFLGRAHDETGLSTDLLKRDLGAVLLRCEALQEENIRRTLEPQGAQVPGMSHEEREAALSLLRDPRLLERILEDFERCGIVGEANNKLVGYIAAVSRKLENPLAIIIQSTSAAGKSSLMESMLSFVPEEERIKYSAMTGQSLYYLGDKDLKHKVLAIVEEEGAERASYAIKLLQSEGELMIASTGKDPQSGRMVTQEYRVEGPVMIFLTTTAIDIDEELMNRCLVLSVDESREQTRRIHELQREKRTLEGHQRKLDKATIVQMHRNAQRLLRPVRVVNPWARRLTFLNDKTRSRRDHEKYLTLIDVIAFLHQQQRQILKDTQRGFEYVEVTLDDIAAANELANEALGRCLDELPPQTRRLLMYIDEMVTVACRRLSVKRGHHRFTRREIREYTDWSNTPLKVHLQRLEELEYLIIHRGGRGQLIVYELLYEGQGQDGTKFLPGLMDVEAIRAQMSLNFLPLEERAEGTYDANRSGVNGGKSGSSPAEVRGVSGPCPGVVIAVETSIHEGCGLNGSKNGADTHIRTEALAAS